MSEKKGVQVRRNSMQQPLPAKDADGKPTQIIVQQLEVRPIHRKAWEIADWRDSIRSAESLRPRRSRLYDIYHDVLLDGHLLSVVEKRYMGVENADWVFLNAAGMEVPEMMQFIDTPAFSTLLRCICESKLWGYSMAEITFFPDHRHQVYNIPKKHMRPESGMISYRQEDDEGFDIRTGRYLMTILEAGNPESLGLLASAAQYALYKRGDFGDWASFCEVFGTPIIDAVWDGFNEDQRRLLESALEKLGSGGTLVRPAGTEVRALDGQGHANMTGELFDRFKDACNAEMSKVILGQTETTESSSSSGYAQAKEHGETEDDVHKTDRRFVRQILNGRFVPMLAAHGIQVEGGYFAVRNEGEEKISLTDRVSIDRTLRVDMGLPIGDDYLYDKYGIEKPKDYDTLKELYTYSPPLPEDDRSGDAAIDDPTDELNGSETDTEVKLALRGAYDALQKGFVTRLKKLFFQAPDAGGAYISARLHELYTLRCCTLHAGPVIRLSLLDAATIQRIYNENYRNGVIDMKAYTQIAAQMTDAIVSGGSFVRPSNLEPSTWVFESLRENVYKFSGAKSLAMYQDFRKALTTTRSFEEFRNKVIGLDREYNERWLRTEYNTARSMAQHAKKWESLSRYEFLEYRTVGDDKVRLAHEKLDGITLRTDDPLWDIIYPPNDWNCRCTVIPGRKDKVDQNRQAAEAASINPDVIKDYFRRNVGKEQVVFKDDHPYFQATGTSELGSFSALENYGMRSVARLVKDANRPAHIRLADVQSARDLWAKTAKVQTRDQMTWINDVAFDLAVQDERWKYANEVPNILAKADEVWSERRNGLVYKRYIRYYQGKALVLEYEVNKPNDWTIIEFSQNILNDTERSRRGALIYTR